MRDLAQFLKIRPIRFFHQFVNIKRKFSYGFSSILLTLSDKFMLQLTSFPLPFQIIMPKNAFCIIDELNR